MKVFMLCTGSDVFGNTLVFDSLRIGFLTADVEVTVDSGASDEVKDAVRDACKRESCAFIVRNNPDHGDFITERLAEATDDSVAFVDPDVVFWAPVESLVVPSMFLCGGRYIGPITSKTVEHKPRLHPSLFIVPSVKALMHEVKVRAGSKWYVKPFKSYRAGSVCWDTLSSLYDLMPDRCYSFSESDMDRYDHVFCGSFQHRMASAELPGNVAEAVSLGNAAARANPEQIRGLWREQVALASENFAWSYVSGLVSTTKGRKFGFSHAWFEPGGFAHVCLTDVEAGKFYFTRLNERTETPSATFDGAGLVLTASSVEVQRYGVFGRPNGWSWHYSAPFSSVKGTIRIGSDVFPVEGSCWFDAEHGKLDVGTPWTWISMRYDNGERTAYYHVNGSCYRIPARTVSDAPVKHPDGTIELDGKTLVPAVPNQTIHDEFTYHEGLYFFEGGHAYVEDVPPGWGTRNIVPIGEMFFRWTLGNTSAAECLHLLWRASQIADDIVDGDAPAGLAMTELLDVLVGALPRNEFFLAHHAEIARTVGLASVLWNASDAWASSKKEDTLAFAYAMRESFMLVVAAVAKIVGNPAHATSVLMELHEYAHAPGNVESFSVWRKS